VAPRLATLVVAGGTQARPVSGVSFRGIRLAHTAPTFLEPYLVPSSGDWSIHPAGAVTLRGTVNVSVTGCLFDHLNGNGLAALGFTRGLRVERSEFASLGDSGIVLVGKTAGIDGTTGDHVEGTSVTENLFREMGVWGKQTAFLFQALAAKTYVARNVAFNGPRSGYNVNDG
jgi:hypothetical protein